MKKSTNYWTRKFHRWGAILCCIPLLLVIATGLMLQVKKQVAWIQPPTAKTDHSEMTLSWDELLRIAKTDSNASIEDWSDVDRLDVRPAKGLVKLRARNRWELQIDLANGEILSSKYRRSDLIESLHDGSFFGEWSKLGIFLANGFVLLALWFTGMWLWYLPFKAKAIKKRRLQQKKSESAAG